MSTIIVLKGNLMKKSIFTITALLCLLVSLVIIFHFFYTRNIDTNYYREDKKLVEEFMDDFDESIEIKEPETTQAVADSKTKVIPLGILEIDSINLSVGFYSPNSWRNNVKYGLQILETSTMPNKKGQLIIASHTGNSSVSYFRNLKKLKEGQIAKIYYLNKIYYYEYMKIDIQEKNGHLKIEKNSDYPLVLITCTKAGGKTQSIYYFKQLNDKTL